MSRWGFGSVNSTIIVHKGRGTACQGFHFIDNISKSALTTETSRLFKLQAIRNCNTVTFSVCVCVSREEVELRELGVGIFSESHLR